jgi:hypothetical protein
MNEPKPRQTMRTRTTAQQARLRRYRRQIAAELPDLKARDQMRHEAQMEPTLSGELRRAIHASPLSLAEISARTSIPCPALDEFLIGERTLRSDVLDRLATSLGLELVARH